MSDRMRPIPLKNLIEWITAEYKNSDAILGIPAQKFYKKSNEKTLPLYGGAIENPIGPAAGPHTQLAQNIIAAYLAGSRFFELKTVQTLDGDDLPVAKPCIDARDEGYNVEWSTELTVQDAFAEYIKAYLLVNILAEELGLGDHNGFAFNMSVGYDLAGIRSPKIDNFIEGLKDASKTAIWQDCMTYLLGHAGAFRKIDPAFINAISPKVCSSITLSTMHGCPPQEIERIANYLLGEKRLHTFIKCNPTLLGFDQASSILARTGFGYLSFDDHHFNNDLQFKDAVPMIRRLKTAANSSGLEFGLKLSNTFPVRIVRGELPGEEMYMSGKALYPLTITLASQLADAFDGDLRIAYSGGADYFNIDRIIKTGLWPVTVATTLLKPGAYFRLKQLADLADRAIAEARPSRINTVLLRELAQDALTDPHYHKGRYGVRDRKINKPVPLTDCSIAPCKEGCPIGQDIPEYIRLVKAGRYPEALAVITAKNPLPHITGTLCPHRCTDKCTRNDYDAPVDVRAAKLLAALEGYETLMSGKPVVPQRTGMKVAVVGAGPAGLSAGYFLAKNGADVTIFDQRKRIGGAAAHVIPDFRISDDLIARDVDLIRKSGVRFVLGADEDFSVKALKEQGYQYIYIAIGAWIPGRLNLEPCDQPVINVLDFLEQFKFARATLDLGQDVAVIGGGDSAMDAARAASRVRGVRTVTIIYRRTQEYMPAGQEELELAFKDGVILQELLSPVSYEKGILKCQKMTLGAPDRSGRRRPLPIEGEFVSIKADSVIAAVGETANQTLFALNGLETDENGRVKVDPATKETCIKGVYIGGDALNGPGSIVEAIADGSRFAAIVSGHEIQCNVPSGIDKAGQIEEITAKKGVLSKNDQHEGAECLECNCICSICAEVCPNRANITVRMENGKDQIIHIDGMCNECGNCETFCPYRSAPYKDKLTLYWNLADFVNSSNAGFVLTDENKVRVRLGLDISEMPLEGDGSCQGPVPDEIMQIIRTVYKSYSYLLCR